MSTFIRDSGQYKPYELQHRFRKRIFVLIKLIILIFFLHLFITHFCLFTMEIDNSAMEPTLKTGDRLLISPLPYGPYIPFSGSRRLFSLHPPERGDLVLYRPEHPASGMFVHRFIDPVVRFFTLQRVQSVSAEVRRQYQKNLIRRVVAVPGDTIELRGPEIFIRSNGQEQLVANVGGEADSGQNFGYTEFTAGPGEYFLLSDDRQNSIDSRHFGPVPGERIAGKVFFVYFPFKRFGSP